jgi:hypothetical protein
MTYEITVRSLEEIVTLAQILKENQITQIHLTDKNGLIDNLESGNLLSQAYPELTIFKTNYALKNHTSKVPEKILANMDGYILQAAKSQVDEILIISGHPRPKFDSLKALQRLAKQINTDPDFADLKNLKFGVSFNPYLPTPSLEEEKERLYQKLTTGLVSSIYLQIGTDTTKLQDGLKFIQANFPTTKIVGSLLIPNQQFLARFQFRPWKGVFLDQDYLENLHLAEQKTREILAIYELHKVEPLIQILPFNSQNILNFRAKYFTK